MKSRLFAIYLLCLILGAGTAQAYSISGSITGGTGLPLRYVFAVPTTLDTFYITIAIPFVNTYGFSGLDEGGYVLFAYQDLNTSITPDLDEPRGFYGGDIPQVFELISDTTGVNIELHPPNQGGFSGTISYSGAGTGTTLLFAYYNPDFLDLPHGGSLLFNNTGNGDYVALVDSFATFYAYAFMDLDGNFAWDPGEPRGVYGGGTPTAIVVQESNFPEGIDITLEETSWTDEPRAAIGEEFALSEVYPNPFNSTATISFTLSSPMVMDVALYDLLGRRVQTLTKGPLSSGFHRVQIEGSQLSSGMYFVRLTSPKRTLSQPVVLLK
ncbi:MAG: T9SS type A sorting domain-containing protein [Calditrichota bacterium]